MKTRTLMFFSILCLAALIVIGSCATTQNPDKMVFERFCGTWANENYSRVSGLGAKWIYNPDGTFLSYSDVLDIGVGGTAYVGTYTVEKRWTDSEGNSWYNVIAYFQLKDMATWYLLFKLDKYNAVLEVEYSNIDFPTEIDKKDSHTTYGIYYRY